MCTTGSKGAMDAHLEHRFKKESVTEKTNGKCREFGACECAGLKNVFAVQ